MSSSTPANAPGPIVSRFTDVLMDMSAKNTNSSGGVDLVHNADHPLEHEAVVRARAYLDKGRWPFHRIGVNVVFGVRPVPSDSRLKVEIENDRLVGTATLFLNFLFLMQDERAFLDHVVPHECAHLLAHAEAERKGNVIKEHGEEWLHWLLMLNPDALPTAKGAADAFDPRPARLFKGGVPAVCNCSGESAIEVFPNEKAVLNGVCSQCESGYRKLERDALPKHTLIAYDYIVDEFSNRRAYR